MRLLLSPFIAPSILNAGMSVMKKKNKAQDSVLCFVFSGRCELDVNNGIDDGRITSSVIN